jgi:hypothetical protein
MRTTPDTASMGRGVSYPGIDPRLWISLAVVTELGVDPANGVYADVQLIPSGDLQTCRIGIPYGGPGYGAWLPLAKDDLVVVLFPRGDAAEGPILTHRLWSGSDPPPPELATSNGDDPPTSPVIVVGEGQTVRIVCRPGATVEVVGDSPASAADPVTLSTPNDSNWSRLASTLQTWATPATPPVPPSLADIGTLKAALLALLAGLDGEAVPPVPWPEATAAERLKGE